MSVDLAAIKQRQKASWAAGDLHKGFGVATVIVGELLCEAVDIHSGEKVLDVACGTGNAALAAARRDAEVTGLDIVPGGLEHARRRFEVEGLSGTFLEGEAENLPFPDDNFDIVLSTFGVMFAPNVDKVASELLRVCRSGGRIGLANWIPEGAGGELMKVMGAYMPPMPPGVRSPFEWGTEKRLRELFGNDINALVATRRTLAWRAGTPEALLQGLRTHNGPFRMFFEALPPERAEACARDLLAMWGRYNQASDGTAKVPQDYLEVVANRS